MLKSEVLNRLVETGDLLLQSAWDSEKGAYRYRVEWNDTEGVSVVLWDDTLECALKRADKNVSYLGHT